MKNLIHRIRYILTLRCDEASRLMSDELDRPLLWWEKFALRGHLVACRVCPPVHKKFKSLASIHFGSATDSVMDDGTKDRIRNAIRDAE